MHAFAFKKQEQVLALTLFADRGTTGELTTEQVNQMVARTWVN
ncbi:hypothetical protein ACFYXQ_46240 [Nocardia jiangxiensis]|uniref:Uncharacterized protein n=1 Tax=Nocardia jiangxiensis TaxID=282685 RepID=A0ABW6SFP3_9NOCA